MILDQPANEIGIPGGEMMAFAESSGDVDTQLGMIAAHALGNIMIEAGDVKEFYFRQARMYVRGNRKLLLVVFIAESAHVPDNLERVCINCINVEQVELHLADDPVEFG